MKKLIPQTIKNLYHLKMAILANLWYGFPSRKIKVIGVTGTNGKTTTCQMIAKILEEAGHKVAMISTINFKITEKEWVNDTKYTTLSSFKVQKFIKRAIAAGCDYLVLEISSHSLDQFRTWGINYQTAVITNVTREHLDYHRTMDEYRRAKLKLFRKAETAVVNLDMENPGYFLRFKNGSQYGYTTQNQNANFNLACRQAGMKNYSEKPSRNSGTDNEKLKIILAENIELGIDRSRFIVDGQPFVINLPGLFNVENALAAICAGLAENISLRTIAGALEKIKNIPGRMEYVENDKRMNILVDFALTPDALEKLYALLMKAKKSGAKIIAVFGSCGERDRGKRPIMGEIASRYADFIILTNDEPYHEDPARIIREITAGIKNKKEGVDLLIIPDRRKAIKKALQLGREDDIIAVTGMGAEESMVVGDQKIPWNDKKVIQELLRESK